MSYPEEIEFFLRLHGLWEPIIDMPPPPEPPYDVETMEPIRSASVSGYRGVARERNGAETADEWQAPERALDEERILVLDAEETPGYE